MAIDVKSFSDMIRRDVFTTKALYCGKVVDLGLDLERFKIKSLVVDAAKGSFLASMVGDKKGVVVPYVMVHSVGDIVIIKHVSPTSVEEEESGESEEAKEAETIKA